MFCGEINADTRNKTTNWEVPRNALKAAIKSARKERTALHLLQCVRIKYCINRRWQATAQNNATLFDVGKWEKY